MKSIFQLLFILTFFFIGCKNVEIDDQNLSKLEIKSAPSDQFFLQRMNPDGTFPTKAYERGLREVQNSLNLENTEPGFDLEWITQGPGNI